MATKNTAATKTLTVKNAANEDVELVLTQNGDNWFDAEGTQRNPETGKIVESKAAAFKRIAGARATNVLQAIKTMEGLASAQNYEYTDEQWGKIYAAIGGQLAKLQAKVAARGKVEAETLIDL